MSKTIDKERLQSLIREGWSNVEIAGLIGCATQTVSKERAKMGVLYCGRQNKYKLGERPQLMDEGEIVRHWCSLEDKAGGITVLAELNLCRADVIVDILRRHGLEPKKRRTRIERKHSNG